jgi:hypothetical protein
MDPNYLQPPEESCATSSNDGDSNTFVASPNRSNRRSWPRVEAHTRNRLSVSSYTPETGNQPSPLTSNAADRASNISWADVASNPLSFIRPYSGTAVGAPSSGADLCPVFPELDTYGGGESLRSGLSYGNAEGLSPEVNLLVNGSLQRLVNLQEPYKIWKFGWRNKFREILANTKPIPDHILEKVRLDHEPIVNAYERSHQPVMELTLQEAFEMDLDYKTSLTKHYLESTEQVLATFCQIDADTMINFTYELVSQVAGWVFAVEEGTEPLTETESARSTDSS